MAPFKTGDRVSVLHLSTSRGPCAAYNRYVLEVEPHDTYGQRVWIGMPDDCPGGPIHDVIAYPDVIEHMEHDLLGTQAPFELEFNLDWHVEMSTPDASRPSWPDGRHGARINVPLTRHERQGHAAKAALYTKELLICDATAFTRWLTRVAANAASQARR
ncbi:hypothetical protein [Streptomyces sp. NPDC059564]|uniref:hypothetical protein n=1 Tax=Streptomyces sp. NPDC059564 TaxID=3346865 RepID=UPI0036B490A4